MAQFEWVQGWKFITSNKKIGGLWGLIFWAQLQGFIPTGSGLQKKVLWTDYVGFQSFWFAVQKIASLAPVKNFPERLLNQLKFLGFSLKIFKTYISKRFFFPFQNFGRSRTYCGLYIYVKLPLKDLNPDPYNPPLTHKNFILVK